MNNIASALSELNTEVHSTSCVCAELELPAEIQFISLISEQIILLRIKVQFGFVLILSIERSFKICKKNNGYSSLCAITFAEKNMVEIPSEF